MTFASIISDIHVLVGIIGLLSGVAALLVAKGKRAHKIVGNTFFISLLAASLFGLHTAYVKTDIPFSTVLFTCFIGFFTIYLVTTSWITVKRPSGKRGIIEVVSLFYIITVAIYAMTYGVNAAEADGGVSKNGAPAMPVEVFYVFASFAAFLAIGDLLLIWRGGINGAKRIARHLWRMCMAFIMSVAILFLGNPHVFPMVLQKAEILSVPVLALPVLTLLVVMIYWLVKVLFVKNKYRKYRAQNKEEITGSEQNGTNLSL